MKPLLRALDWVSRPAWFEPDGMANNRLNSSSFCNTKTHKHVSDCEQENL